MTYSPAQAGVMTGEDYFRSVGVLQDGMEPIIASSGVVPAFDDYEGTALPITDSVAGPGAAYAVSWAGWNLASAKTKLLMTTYGQPSLSDWVGFGCHTSTLPTGLPQDAYTGMLYGNVGNTNISKYTTAGGWAYIALESTIYQEESVNAPVWGITLYVDGSSNVQKVFVKSGSAQWVQVLSTSDSAHTSFQSVFLFHRGSNIRFITPIMVWGA